MIFNSNKTIFLEGFCRGTGAVFNVDIAGILLYNNNTASVHTR